MATLELRPPPTDGQDVLQDAYNLMEETSIYDTSDVLRPEILSVIHHDNHSTVYRAKLGKLDIVIKFARCSSPVEDLEKESNAYQNELLDLQGDCVPRFHGFFRSEDRKADTITGCIVLDYCGEALQKLRTLPYPERVKIMECVGKVHMTGLILREFSSRNTLRLGDRYTLIDFHKLRKHDCYWDGDLRSGKPIPSLSEMSCMSIANFCLDMDIWAPRWPVVDIGGYVFHNRGNYPDQETVARLLPEQFENRRANREVLLEWLAGFRTLQEDDPNPPSVDEYKKSMPTLPIPYESQ